MNKIQLKEVGFCRALSMSNNSLDAKISFEDYDKFIDQACEVESFNHKPYWPNIDEIMEYAEKFPALNMTLFLSWLLEMNGEPRNKAEARACSEIKQYLREHLTFTDGDSK